MPMSSASAATSPAGGRSKLESLQAGRGLAALAVLLFHINIIYTTEIDMIDRPYPILNIGAAGVEYFFVLSGFIIGLIHAGDIGQPEKFGRYALKRFIRIYPIFWIILTAFIFAKLAIGRPEASLDSGLSYFWSYALLPFAKEPPLVAAWTLSHELLFYAVFGLAILNKRVGSLVFLLWMTACAVSFLLIGTGFTELQHPFGFLLADYNLLFGFGVFAASQYRSLTVRGAWTLIGCGLITFVIAGYLMVGADLSNLELLFGGAAACVVPALVRLEELGCLSVHWSLCRLGDASYSIYLIHGPAAVVIAILLVKLGLAAPLGLNGSLLIMGAGALIAGLLCYQLCERPLLAYLSKSLLRRPQTETTQKAS